MDNMSRTSTNPHVRSDSETPSISMADDCSQQTLFRDISQHPVHTSPRNPDPTLSSSSTTPDHAPPFGFKLNTGASIHGPVIPSILTHTTSPTLPETPGFPVTKHGPNVTLKDLKQRFDRPFAEVAKEFKICKGMMKTICLQLGIARWPYRQVRSMARMIDSIRENIARCALDSCEKRRYERQLEKMLELYHTFYLEFPTHQRPASDTMEEDEDDESLEDLSPSILTGHDDAPLPEASTPSWTSSHCRHIPSPVESLLFLKRSQPVKFCTKMGEPWTVSEQSALLEGIRRYGRDWKRIAKVVGSRSPVQVLNHAQTYLNPVKMHTSSGLGILSKSKRKRKALSKKSVVPVHTSTASLKERKIVKKAWL